MVGNVVQFRRHGSEPTGMKWVQRTVVGDSGEAVTYYVPLQIVKDHNNLNNVPNNWDWWFSQQGYQLANETQLTPLTDRYHDPDSGRTILSNAVSIVSNIFRNNPKGQSTAPMEFATVGTFRDGVSGSTVFVEPESGLILRAHRPAGSYISSSNSWEAHVREVYKPTGVAEIDRWDELLRTGQYGEFVFGQSGFGQHTLFVAGGSYSGAKIQGREINGVVRSNIQNRAVVVQKDPANARGPAVVPPKAKWTANQLSNAGRLQLADKWTQQIALEDGPKRGEQHKNTDNVRLTHSFQNRLDVQIK